MKGHEQPFTQGGAICRQGEAGDRVRVGFLCRAANLLLTVK